MHIWLVDDKRALGWMISDQHINDTQGAETILFPKKTNQKKKKMCLLLKKKSHKRTCMS